MQLLLALACDEADVRDDGKVDIRGVFNELQAPGFPAAQDRMTVVFVVQWDAEETGEQPLRADLLDDAGRKVLTIEGHTQVPAGRDRLTPPQTRLVLPLEDVVFPHPGRYEFELVAGADVVRACPLWVAERPASPSTPGNRLADRG